MASSFYYVTKLVTSGQLRYPLPGLCHLSFKKNPAALLFPRLNTLFDTSPPFTPFEGHHISHPSLVKMKFSLSTVLVLTLASEATLASSWFGKAGQYTFPKDSFFLSDPLHSYWSFVTYILDAQKALTFACFGAA